VITPTLDTKRIHLRPPGIEDVQAVFDNWATDPEVTRYLRWDPHANTDVTAEWLTTSIENITGDTDYTWFTLNKENDEVFGSFGLFYNEKRAMFEVGYCMMRKYWNQGYATEAVRAMVDFAKEALGLTKLFAMHAKENPSSGKVLEKVGFVYFEDGEYESFDGSRIFKSRNLLLEF